MYNVKNVQNLHVQCSNFKIYMYNVKMYYIYMWNVKNV